MAFTYLDHAATTPMRPEAIDAMMPFFQERFANPSGSHRFARDARRAVDDARDQVAAALGAAPGEVIFTGGGSESNNTMIAGVDAGPLVCSAAEHHAVLHPIERRGGGAVTVNPDGHVDLDRLGEAIDDRTALVSIMAVNNEVGTITDLAEVAALVRDRAPQAVLHTDAVQAPHWCDLASITPLVDALSISAHKFGGPKGVGALVLRDGVSVTPLIAGGGQERDRRSGTHNVAGIVAMAAALEATERDRASEGQRLAALRDDLVDRLMSALDGVHETVDRRRKIAGSAHVCIEGIETEELLFLLDEAEVCASAASACASGAMERSHVLAAMGVPRHLAAGALRMSLGHTTSGADIDRASEVIIDAVTRLRSMQSRPAVSAS